MTMTAVWWIGSILLWGIVGTVIGRKMWLLDGADDDSPMYLIGGLLWPIWVPIAIALSPFYLAYRIMTRPPPWERLTKKQQQAEQKRLDLAADLKRLEAENAQIDALITKIKGEGLR